MSPKTKNVDVDQKWTGDEVVITCVCLVGHYSRVISIISKASKEGELELFLLLRSSQNLPYLSWLIYSVLAYFENAKLGWYTKLAISLSFCCAAVTLISSNSVKPIPLLPVVFHIFTYGLIVLFSLLKITHYTLTSVFIFSILFTIYVLRCWQREFVLKI